MDQRARVSTGDTGIAVVGMSGRFPGADDVDAFWGNISAGVESFTRLTDEELLRSGEDPQAVRRPDYVRVRPVLSDIRGWDAGFFGSSPREAALDDPQQRLFAEVVWEALEMAGYAPPEDRGAVGVFAGTNISTYLLTRPYLFRMGVEIDRLMAGNDKDALATTMSWRLDLRGPSVSVQTFCSTSLVALHLACASLRRGECDLALAGGVSVRVPDRFGYVHREGSPWTPDGQVRPFDAGARGSLYGDGAAVVALKRLDRAVADRDTVLAVIRGSAVNNDGALKFSFGAPTIDGQRRCVAAAIADAGVDPAAISYVEAHGAATKVGDPMEVAALTLAFGPAAARQQCLLGSVKANVGHLDRASGVTGLIKVIQSLRHELIPGTRNFTAPNPEIDFANSPFRVTAEPTPWPRREGRPRIAGLSSLGTGGTNAHAIIEEAPPVPPRPPRPRRWQVLAVSARSEQAVEQACARLADRLARPPDLDLGDVGYTLQVGRRLFAHRRAVVADTTAGAAALLADPTTRLGRADATVGRRVGFLIAGAGAQYPGMAAALYAHEPDFRADVDECLAVLGLDEAGQLSDIFTASRARPSPVSSTVHDHLVEPAVFVAGYALARLFQRWCGRPELLLGHGLGEYVAACLSGVLSLPDALRLVAHRARLTAAVEAGAAARLTEWVADNVTVHPPTIPYLSNVTGEPASAETVADPGYWARPMGRTVGFGDGLARMLRGGDLALVEIGPGPSLGDLAREHLPARPGQAPPIVTTLPAAGRPDDPRAALAEAVARLWLAGVTIDWPALHRVTGSDWRPGRIPLPTYPFERQECWLEADPLVTGGRAGPGLDTNDPAGDPAALPALPEERWINVPVWRQTAPRPAEVTDGQTWLVLADEGTAGPLAARLSAGLAAAGGRVTLARPGGRYADGPDGFALRPGSAEDATAALRELAARGLAPQRVLHLWTLEPDAKSDAKPGADPDAATARCLQRGLHTLIALARATGDLGLGPWSLDVVTAGSQRVLPGDPVRPELATVVGPCRLMPVEYPRVRTRLVDIDATTEHRELLAELRAEPAEPVVALRGGRRWVPAYEVLDAACIAEDRPAARPRRGGAYLVTGGLGGVGLAMAERLARDHRARLVLMGRTRVPPREEWGRILASGATAGEVRRRLEGLLRLEAAGAQVVTVHGDVSRVEDVRAAVAAALDRFGGLHGVLHCAGVPASGLMQFKTAADIEKVLAPKVGGALALARVLREVPDPVDFVALFSSTASVTGGGAGQVDYCAANAFLDAFALSDPIPGCAVTSVGWGSWCWDGWSTGLDGRDEGARQSLRHHRETFGIGFEQGWQALQRALAAGEPHVVVSTQDFPALVSTGRRAATRPARDAPGRRPRPDLPTALVEPQTDTELAIAAVWAAALGLDQVGVHDDFVDLGGNSLIGMEIIAEVRRVLDLSHLPPRLLHQAPTVAALAKAAEAERAPADAPPDGPADGARDQRQTRIEQRRQMLRRGK